MRIGILSAAVLALASGPVSASDLRLTLNPEWAGQPVAVPSAPKSNRTEQQLRITRVSALLSGFALRRSDGSAIALPNQYGFIDGGSGRTSVMLSGIEDGAYAGLEFTIGLPHDIDAGDSSRWPSGHPLNPLADGMYWGWQGGYVFAAIEGEWWSGSAEPRRGFSFHLAAGAGAMRVQLAVPFVVKGSTVVRCAWDLAAVLRPLQFEPEGTGSSTHSRTNDPLAGWLAAAVVRSVGWRGAGEDFAQSAQAPPTGVIPRWSATSGRAEHTAGPLAVPPAPFTFVVPAGFPQPNLPADNPLTAAGVELGKALFSDPRLSGNGSQSCVSCHQPAHAFSDSAALSLGAEGTHGVRHSPSLFNLAWQPAYAWDGSQPLIRDQVRAAMTTSFEMNGDLTKIVALLSADEAVVHRFQQAFGSPAVTPERLGLALEQYLLTLVAADSKFDHAARGEATLTWLEKRGLELFLTEYDPAHGRRGADCFHCHGGALFGDYVYRDNGLGAAGVERVVPAFAKATAGKPNALAVPSDRGRAVVTGNADDEGKFKTPSLRNAAQRAPYMHDGRMADLAQVVEHYTHGVKRTPNLDPNLGKHPDRGIDLSAEDQAALVAFLKTL